MKFRRLASLHDCDNASLPRAPYRDRISGQPVARTLHPLDGIVTATATTGARPAAPHAPAKPAAQPSAFPRLAAVDIGTNSIAAGRGEAGGWAAGFPGAWGGAGRAPVVRSGE